MKKKWFLMLLCVLNIACSSSDKKSPFTNKDGDDFVYDDWESKTHPEFDSKRHVIYYKKELRQDIKIEMTPQINIKNPKRTDIIGRLWFYNYGENIRLTECANDDYFTTGIGAINFAYALKSEDAIYIDRKEHSEKYGDWAVVNLKIGANYINNVFMTPLAMNAYKTGNDNSYIFIQFVTNSSFMNVLFLAGPNEWLIVDQCPNVILADSEMSHCNAPLGPGKFWQKK